MINVYVYNFKLFKLLFCTYIFVVYNSLDVIECKNFNNMFILFSVEGTPPADLLALEIYNIET